jgi:ankyrin repeat protein
MSSEPKRVRTNNELIEIVKSYMYDYDLDLVLVKIRSYIMMENNEMAVNEKDAENRTPLMYAMAPEITQLLIECGANVNARDSYARTAIMYTRLSSIARLLIHNKADLNFRDHDGKTALLHAILLSSSNYHPQQHPTTNPLVFNNNSSSNHQNVGVNNNNNNNNRALVIGNDREALIDVLMQSVTKVNLNLEDNQYANAILYAVELGDFETLRKLIWCGADVNSVDKAKRSTLILAVERQSHNINMTRLLIENRVYILNYCRNLIEG